MEKKKIIEFININNLKIDGIRDSYRFSERDKPKSGNFCVAFRLESQIKGNEDLCLRVWWNSPIDSDKCEKKFRQIKDWLKKADLPYFTDFSYEPKALEVDGEKLYVTTRNWIDGKTLTGYIKSLKEDSIHFKEKMHQLADSFLEMCYCMREKEISHGDLSSQNILVTTDGQIKLIDYDSVFVPSMGKDYYQVTGGRVGYQHPYRIEHSKDMVVSMDDDNFSQWVIYLSLLAIYYKPELSDDDYIDRDLLFKHEDFKHNDELFTSPGSGFQLISEIPELNKPLRTFANFVEGEIGDVRSIVEYFPRPKPKTPIKIREFAGYCGQCGHYFDNQIDLFCPDCGKQREILT